MLQRLRQWLQSEPGRVRTVLRWIQACLNRPSSCAVALTDVASADIRWSGHVRLLHRLSGFTGLLQHWAFNLLHLGKRSQHDHRSAWSRLFSEAHGAQHPPSSDAGGSCAGKCQQCSGGTLCPDPHSFEIAEARADRLLYSVLRPSPL